MNCPICDLRVNEWEVTSAKTQVVESKQVHKSCMTDFKLRYGWDWEHWSMRHELLMSAISFT